MALRSEALALGLEDIAVRLEGIALRLEDITVRLEAIALRLEAIALGLEAIGFRLGAIGFRQSILDWRPSVLGWRPPLLGWRPSLLGWRPSLLIALASFLNPQLMFAFDFQGWRASYIPITHTCSIHQANSARMIGYCLSLYEVHTLRDLSCGVNWVGQERIYRARMMTSNPVRKQTDRG